MWETNDHYILEHTKFQEETHRHRELRGIGEGRTHHNQVGNWVVWISSVNLSYCMNSYFIFMSFFATMCE